MLARYKPKSAENTAKLWYYSSCVVPLNLIHRGHRLSEFTYGTVKICLSISIWGFTVTPRTRWKNEIRLQKSDQWISMAFHDFSILFQGISYHSIYHSSHPHRLGTSCRSRFPERVTSCLSKSRFSSSASGASTLPEAPIASRRPLLRRRWVRGVPWPGEPRTWNYIHNLYVERGDWLRVVWLC